MNLSWSYLDEWLHRNHGSPHWMDVYRMLVTETERPLVSAGSGGG